MTSFNSFNINVQMDTYKIRSEVASAPSIVPPEVKIRITVVQSRQCIREYNMFRDRMNAICIATGRCRRNIWYKPYKCWIFLADAVIDDYKAAVGYLFLIEDRARKALIYDMYVDKAWRGLGIGQALVKAAIRFAMQRNIIKIKAILPDEDAAKIIRLHGMDMTLPVAEHILVKYGFEPRGDDEYVLHITKKREWLEQVLELRKQVEEKGKKADGEKEKQVEGRVEEKAAERPAG